MIAKQPPPVEPRLVDVARLADVSISTVSRALSHPDRVNHATRARVDAAAAGLRYVVNAQARALVSGRTHTIAVIVSDVSNPFYFDIIKGTAEAARTHGYGQLLVDTGESPDVENDMILRLRKSFDGVILAASRLPDRRLIELANEMPVVALNRRASGVPSVVIDTPSGFAQAVEHLVSLGHERIAYVSGPTSSWLSETRWKAVQKAAVRLGVTAVRIGPFSPQRSSGPAAADTILNSGATAAIAFNDLMAIGILARLRERGLNVPADFSIVGCDDIFGADFCEPPLTTLAAATGDAGRTAVTMLLGMIESPERVPLLTTEVLPTHLTIRSSTGPVRTS
jgi:DNA-binding LacI/PurR family transcriptional regulator